MAERRPACADVSPSPTTLTEAEPWLTPCCCWLLLSHCFRGGQITPQGCRCAPKGILIPPQGYRCASEGVVRKECCYRSLLMGGRALKGWEGEGKGRNKGHAWAAHGIVLKRCRAVGLSATGERSSLLRLSWGNMVSRMVFDFSGSKRPQLVSLACPCTRTEGAPFHLLDLLFLSSCLPQHCPSSVAYNLYTSLLSLPCCCGS